MSRPKHYCRKCEEREKRDEAWPRVRQHLPLSFLEGYDVIAFEAMYASKTAADLGTSVDTGKLDSGDLGANRLAMREYRRINATLTRIGVEILGDPNETKSGLADMIIFEPKRYIDRISRNRNSSATRYIDHADRESA